MARFAVRGAMAGIALLAAAGPAAAQGTIRGMVFDSLVTRAPLEGARVLLDRAPNSAVTDRNGRFVLRDVPAGTYLVGFIHPQYDALDLESPSLRVTVRDGGDEQVVLAMPSASTIARPICGAPLEAQSALVFGTAGDGATGAPLPGAVVQASWYEAEIGGGGVRSVTRTVLDTARADGAFVLCGVPNDIALSVTAAFEGRTTGELPLTLDRAELARQDLLVGAAADSTRLLVTVLSADGKPVEGVTVQVHETAATARTDAEGMARLGALPTGTRPVLVRRPGVRPVTRLVPLRGDIENVAEVRLGATITELPTVAVMGTRGNTLDQATRDRIWNAGGRVYDAKEIEAPARGNIGFWSTIPGMRINASGPDPIPLMWDHRRELCRPNLWYNGAQMLEWEARDLRALLLGATRLEVYPRAEMVPLDYRSLSGCGVIAIWG